MAHGKLPAYPTSVVFTINQCWHYLPTLEVASVRLFSVVDFPDEGFPTRPMRGSRGIEAASCALDSDYIGPSPQMMFKDSGSGLIVRSALFPSPREDLVTT